MPPVLTSVSWIASELRPVRLMLHRRVAGDDDRLLERAKLHRDVDLEVAAGAQQDALVTGDREAGQLRGHREGAGRQVDQPVIAGAVGDGDARTEEHLTDGRNGDAGQRAALIISNGSTQAAIAPLGQHLACGHKARHDGQSPNHHFHGPAPFVCDD